MDPETPASLPDEPGHAPAGDAGAAAPVSAGVAVLEPRAAYGPPPLLAPWAVRPSPATRRRNWIWTLSLAACVLVAVAGVGALYLNDLANRASIRSLQGDNAALNSRNDSLSRQLQTVQANLTATLGELASANSALEHPHLTIWNVPQTIDDATIYLAGGIPDTFTYHLVATSSGPMSVSILTLEEWAAAIECVDYGTGTTHYCMHHSGAVVSWLGVTSVNYDFHLAEGCADYVAVFTAATRVTVTPNVSVTYNPASVATGACA